MIAVCQSNSYNAFRSSRYLCFIQRIYVHFSVCACAEIGKLPIFVISKIRSYLLNSVFRFVKAMCIRSLLSFIHTFIAVLLSCFYSILFSSFFTFLLLFCSFLLNTKMTKRTLIIYVVVFPLCHLHLYNLFPSLFLLLFPLVSHFFPSSPHPHSPLLSSVPHADQQPLVVVSLLQLEGELGIVSRIDAVGDSL